MICLDDGSERTTIKITDLLKYFSDSTIISSDQMKTVSETCATGHYKMVVHIVSVKAREEATQFLQALNKCNEKNMSIFSLVV